VLNAVRIWILLSTLLVASGWILSAFHQLNCAGYGVILGLATVVFLIWIKQTGWRPRKNSAQLAEKFRHRFKRPAPLMFLLLALMAFAAGALYPSQNNDSCEYRIPRVWHWLAAGRWHWIHTLDFRMNVAGCDFEWLVAPLMLFTKQDRCLFLVNWVSLLLLPGLIFSVFTRLQVRGRVAWWWMWLLSSGLCYVMQARSDVNDSFAVIYALASVEFALRAREKNRVSDLWLSILAVALLTGAKQTDLPLALPWLIAVLPSWRLAKMKAPATLCICAVALLVSVVPLTYLNYRHAGNWMGFPPTSVFWKLESPSPIWCLIGNTFCLPLQNLIPPYFPFVNQWNQGMEHFVQTPWGSHFQAFEAFGRMGRGASETNAGLGLWVFLFTCVSLAAAKMCGEARRPPGNSTLKWLRWIPYVSLLIFMARVDSYQNARQLAPYYVFLFPAVLVSHGHAVLVRKRWWQWLGLTVMVLTAAMLVVARDRPLFPAESILVPLKEKHPQWRFLSKAWDSYACRLATDIQRSAFQNEIPAQEQVLGYATVRGEEEPGQWIPFGRRRVERVLPNDNPRDAQAKGIHYVLVDSSGLELLQMTIGDWTNRFDGTLMDTLSYESDPGVSAEDYLVRLNARKVKQTNGAAVLMH
jgi:hypothetical protein